MKRKSYPQLVKGLLNWCQYFDISAYEVSKEFTISKSTACRLYNKLKTVKLEDYHKENLKMAHIMLKLTSKHKIREILYEVIKYPRISIDQLRTQIIPGCKVSRSLIQKTLLQIYFKFCASSKPFLRKQFK